MFKANKELTSGLYSLFGIIEVEENTMWIISQGNPSTIIQDN